MYRKTIENDLCTHFGVTSEKSSIFNRPAGVSPMLMSMKTIGRVEGATEVEDMMETVRSLMELN